MSDKNRKISIIIAAILGCVGLFYLGGMLGQLLGNYAAWMDSGGVSGESTMKPVSWNPLICFPAAFSGNGIKGILMILLIAGAIFAYVKLHDKFDGKHHDPRGFARSKSGIYGTASWMDEKEMKEVLEISPVPDAKGTILGEYKGKAVCMPEDTRLNRHIAVFGASGTMKSRAIIRNALFQALRRSESVIVTDSKGELYPDHLLTGAVFEVYRDVNGNQQFDPDVDELVDTLSECEPGLYELAELRYGGYFLYEKQAPVNYVKDNGYHYFEIVTDGEMVEVENKAGVGFINDHMVGNLKIVKTSSDGRVDGFSFRVTGENYDEVFTTNANGEIFIENLRIGKYTVTEVEDSVSAGYKRPDPFEIELTADETLTVNVHNDKVTTDHPDSLKTGDDSHMILWVSLMLASLGVLIGTILYSRKKKHLAD